MVDKLIAMDYCISLIWGGIIISGLSVLFIRHIVRCFQGKADFLTIQNF